LDPKRQRTITLIWPIVCFIVLGSTLFHGLSTLAISLGGHFSRKEGERAPLIGDEREGLHGMVFDEENEENEERSEEDGRNEEDEEAEYRGYSST
jgi:NhaP-type Na+/H+ or K+/H+ antiporter